MARMGLYKIEHCKVFPRSVPKSEGRPGTVNFLGGLDLARI